MSETQEYMTAGRTWKIRTERQPRNPLDLSNRHPVKLSGALQLLESNFPNSEILPGTTTEGPFCKTPIVH